MFYVKNLPGWERGVRIAAGGMMIGTGMLWLPDSAMGYALDGMGLMAAMTGMIGFCPMCAMVGRKLDKKG
jgi:hypothetical protein